MKRLTGILLIVLSAASFGTLAIFGRYAYAAGMDTFTLLFLRFLDRCASDGVPARGRACVPVPKVRVQNLKFFLKAPARNKSDKISAEKVSKPYQYCIIHASKINI